MATEFFESINAKLQQRYAVVPVVPAVLPEPPHGLLARLLAWLKRLFRG